MKRINDRTVELTDEEIHAKRGFDNLLDHGRSVTEAARILEEIHGDRLSREFYEYLVQ